MSVCALDLDDWPENVLAGYTTRSGGVSDGAYAGFNLGDHVGDSAAAVAANRRLLRAALPDAARLAWLQQVHGKRVVAAAAGPAHPDADASWTGQAGVACTVLTADCLPVLFCSDDGAVVAAAHAGWRGLAAGVLEETVAALPCRPASLLAWLGPCIGPCHYRVGTEVRAAFAASPAVDDAFVADGDDGYLADLSCLAMARLEALGITRISATPACTACDENAFFSHRRDGITGRMAAFVMRAPTAPAP